MAASMKKKVFGGLAWRFGERICAQGVSFVVSIILARLLLPSDYGAIAMVTIFISISNILVDSGLGSALVQKRNADKKDFSSVFYFNMIFSVLLYMIVFFASPAIARFYKMEIVCPVLRVLAISILIAGVKSIQVSYVQRNMLFKRFFWSTLIGTISSAVVGITMAYMGFGIWALVAQSLTNTVMDTAVLWITVKWRPTLDFSLHRLKGLFGFGWKILFWSLLNNVYENLRSLIIGKKYSSKDLAFYTKGKSWPYLVIENVNTTISSVLFPALSKYQDDKIRLKEMARMSISMSSYIIAPILMGLAALSTPIVSLVLTDKWLPSVPYMIICCIYLMFMPMQTANLEAIKAMGRSDIVLKVDIIKKIVQVGLLLIAMNISVMAIALSAIITTVFACIVNAFPNRRLMNYTYGEQLKDLLPNIISACIMGSVVMFVSDALSGKISRLLIIVLGIILGAIIYLLISVITNNKNYKYLIGILKEKRKSY